MNIRLSQKGISGIGLLVTVVVALLVLGILFWGPIKSTAEGFLHLGDTRQCTIVAGEGMCKAACDSGEIEFSFGCKDDEFCCVPRDTSNGVNEEDQGTIRGEELLPFGSGGSGFLKSSQEIYQIHLDTKLTVTVSATGECSLTLVGLQRGEQEIIPRKTCGTETVIARQSWRELYGAETGQFVLVYWEEGSPEDSGEILLTVLPDQV